MRAGTIVHCFRDRARAPYLPPRRRPLAPHDVARVLAWVGASPGYHPAAPVRVSEWISLDPHHVPHTLMLTIVERGVPRVLMVEEAAERIHRRSHPTAVAEPLSAGLASR